MNNTVEVTGGDGAFVHIDELNPNIQIFQLCFQCTELQIHPGTRVLLQEVLEEKVMGSFFINPTDYDSKSKTLYGSYKKFGMYS
ncbi:MAG: hypothetical protein IPI60_06095 [Saprospiraceae bacterium]|nr:hypothetical protein [Saprospiraceae bacterium]